MNKPIRHGLILASLILASPTWALECTMVAKLKRIDNLSGISIWRAATQQMEWAGLDKLELCAGDKLSVNQEITDAGIFYYQENSKLEPLPAGMADYEVKAIPEPCGMWCKLENKAEHLWLALTDHAPPAPPTLASGVGRGNDESNADILFMPLAINKRKADAFYLFAGSSPVPVFWRGGQKPYQVRVKNKNGQVISEAELQAQETSLTLPETEPGQTYHLMISPAQGKAYDTPLRFTVPPFPLSPPAQRLPELARLLCDAEHDWRLEIWRQLQQLPDSEAARNFKAHLVENDVETEKLCGKH